MQDTQYREYAGCHTHAPGLTCGLTPRGTASERQPPRQRKSYWHPRLEFTESAYPARNALPLVHTRTATPRKPSARGAEANQPMMMAHWHMGREKSNGLHERDDEHTNAGADAAARSAFMIPHDDTAPLASERCVSRAPALYCITRYFFG